MAANDYSLPELSPAQQKRPIIWLNLGLVALVAAGLFSLLLVLSRTPGIQDIIPWTDFFHTALIVHVDLSVLIWFLSFAALLWSIQQAQRAPALEKVALSLAILGTSAIIIAPFTGEAQPLLNNYIPILQQPLFLLGLGLFTSGIALQLMPALLHTTTPHSTSYTGSQALQFGIRSAAMTTLIALLIFIYSYLTLPTDLTGKTYFEYLFWGSGHVLQFTHSLMMLVAWLWISQGSGVQLNIAPKTTRLLLSLCLIPAFIAIPISLGNDTYSLEHRTNYTELMRWGGLTSLPLGLMITYYLLRANKATGTQRPIRSALICSVLLFATGGVLAFMIHGINVVIPAHYHGSIVGITLAFMGLAYLLLPKLGFSAPDTKLARIQPYVYGGGQLMHILGLAWSGGYGVQRKTAGAAQGLDRLPEIAGMAMMGLGGLIAIIGGLLFLIVMIQAMRKR